MKLKFTHLCLGLFFIAACKKEAKESDAIFYENACAWDNNGKPTCLLQRDSISANMLGYINSTLQEKKDLRATFPDLLSSNAKADIEITQPSDVYVTFVSQGTGVDNSFAFYTFPTNQPPINMNDVKKITYIFPNVGANTPLLPGDKVKIGHFDAGTSVGFVLLQHGWDWNTKRPNTSATHLFSNDRLNAEADPALRKHAVLIEYAPEKKVLIGFEDATRSMPDCDNDFNDVVFYATIK